MSDARKFVQLTAVPVPLAGATGVIMFAVADDGTAWISVPDNGAWQRVLALPPKDAAETT